VGLIPWTEEQHGRRRKNCGTGIALIEYFEYSRIPASRRFEVSSDAVHFSNHPRVGRVGALCATRLTAGEDKEDVINLAPKWEGRPDNFDHWYVEMGDGVLIVTNHGDLKGIRGGEPLPEGSARGGRQTKIPPASFESDSPSAPFFRAGVRLNSQLAIEASYLYPGDFTTTSSFRRQAGFFIPDFTEYPQTERDRLHRFLFGPRIFLPVSQRWSFSASAGANILVNFSSLSYLAGARLKPEGFVDVVFHRGSTRLNVAPYANLTLSYRWSPEVEFNLEYQFLDLSDRQDLQ